MDYTEQNKAISAGIDSGLTPQESLKRFQAGVQIPYKLNADNLATADIKTLPTDTTDYTKSFMSGISGGLTENQKQLQDARKNYEDAQLLQGSNNELTNYNQSLTDYNKALSNTPSYSQTYTDILGSTGANDMQKQLNELNIQAAQLNNSYNQGLLDTEGKVIPMQFITGQQAQIQKQYAVRAGAISAMQQALQGNITAAKQTAKDMVDLQYKDQENIIAQKKATLDANYQALTTAEKKRADELNYILTQQQNKIDEEKKNKENINTVLLTAAQNGADNDTLNKIQNSKTYADAIINSGQYIKTQEKGSWDTFTDPNTGEIKLLNKTTGVVKNVSSSSTNLGEQVGEIYGLPSFNTSSNNPGVNRSDRNNNPGNIKVSDFTKDWEGVIGVENRPAQDGGNFLIFDSAENGINAIGKLLQEGKSYQGITAQQAIKRYNGNGSYGASDVGLNPNEDFQLQIKDPQKLKEVANAIAIKEGFTGSKQTPTVDDSKKMALALILGSGKFTKDQKSDLTKAITSGQDPLTVVKNQAKNIMGQTLATDLDKYEVAKEQLKGIQSLLTEYYKNGGKTNIFSGNFEKVINKLGEVNDPKLVEIATNIQAALQVYRNAVSGTAYSVQEGKDIASIFPGINKSQGLNEAIINGRIKAFDTTIDAKYKNTLGDIYTKLKDTNIPVINEEYNGIKLPTSSSSTSGSTYNGINLPN